MKAYLLLFVRVMLLQLLQLYWGRGPGRVGKGGAKDMFAVCSGKSQVVVASKYRLTCFRGGSGGKQGLHTKSL